LRTGASLFCFFESRRKVGSPTQIYFGVGVPRAKVKLKNTNKNTLLFFVLFRSN